MQQSFWANLGFKLLRKTQIKRARNNGGLDESFQWNIGNHLC